MNGHILTQIGAVGMTLFALVSLFPFDLSKGCKSASLYLPIPALLMLLAYEIGIRSEIPEESIPIRIDLIFVRPVIAFILATGVFRWIWVVARVLRNPSETRKSQRVPQLLATGIIACICILWFLTSWWI